MRFGFITDAIANNYTAGLLPTQRILAPENDWGLVSGVVLHHDNNPEGPVRLVVPNSMEINNIAEAILVLCILMRQHTITGSRPRGEVDMETIAGQALILGGRPSV